MSRNSPEHSDDLQLGLSPDALQDPQVRAAILRFQQEHADEVHAVIPEQQL